MCFNFINPPPSWLLKYSKIMKRKITFDYLCYSKSRDLFTSIRMKTFKVQDKQGKEQPFRNITDKKNEHPEANQFYSV